MQAPFLKKCDKSKSIRVIHSALHEEQKILGDSPILLRAPSVGLIFFKKGVFCMNRRFYFAPSSTLSRMAVTEFSECITCEKELEWIFYRVASSYQS